MKIELRKFKEIKLGFWAKFWLFFIAFHAIILALSILHEYGIVK